MKKLAILSLFFVISYSTFGQKASDAFSAKYIIWYGLDFSNSKFVGSFNQVADLGSKDEDDIRLKYFAAWNNLIINEIDKYDIRGAFRKNDISYNLSMVEKRNLEVDNNKLFSLNTTDSYHLNPDKVSEIVAEYDMEEKSGIGLVFIVESFDKFKEQGNYYVTFFDIATKKVLFTRRLTGKPRGFGLRNYWARTYYEVIKNCKDSYKSWVREAKRD